MFTIDLKPESISFAHRVTWLQCPARAEISELYVYAMFCRLWRNYPLLNNDIAKHLTTNWTNILYYSRILDGTNTHLNLYQWSYCNCLICECVLNVFAFYWGISWYEIGWLLMYFSSKLNKYKGVDISQPPTPSISVLGDFQVESFYTMKLFICPTVYMWSCLTHIRITSSAHIGINPLISTFYNPCFPCMKPTPFCQCFDFFQK